MRLSCFIHTLQLVVKDGLNQSECIRSSLGKVAEIAKLSHKSITMAEKLQNENLSIQEAVITRGRQVQLLFAVTVRTVTAKKS